MSHPVFDLHCDTADRLAWQTLPKDLRLACGADFYGPGDGEDPAGCRELARNRCHVSLEAVGETPWAQCFACFIPDELAPEPAVRFYRHVAAYLEAEVQKNASAVALVSGADEIRPVLQSGRMAAIRTIENARLFAADLGLVGRLAERGVLMASLSWNAEGPLASGCDSHAGLTRLGEQALTEMERAGMVLDVSHLNDECFDEVVAHATRPFVASHSNSRAVCGAKRNLTDDQFRTIRDMGGIVGLNYCSEFLSNDATDKTAADVTFDQLAAHIEHWLDLGGEDVIALGGDWDGATVPAFLSDASKMPEFQNMLSKHFGKTVMQKLCSDNALAFFERY